MVKKRGLGKGIDAVFQDNNTESSGTLMTLRLSDVEPNKNQPRKNFDAELLSELAESIKEHGVLQPIVVRSVPGGVYQIIAGERRWRASRIAGLSEIPALILEADDNKTLEVALIENLQRKDLSTIEEAQGYRALIVQFGLTQEEVATRVGKSRSAVTNALRLLNLPEAVLEHLENGNISAGHARVMVGVTDTDRINWMLDEIIKNELNVRQTEQLVKKPFGAKEENKPKEENTWGEPWYKEVESSLREILGRKVNVRKKGKRGSIEIQFYSQEELEYIAEKLSKED